MRSISILFILFLILFARLGVAAESAPTPSPSPTPDPVVEITARKSYSVKKYSLFPLKIPSYVFKGVTWPLMELGKFLERSELFSFQERNWLIFPILDAGGGDGFGGGIYFQYSDLFRKGYTLRMDYRINTNLDQKAHLILYSPPVAYLWDRPFSYEIGAEFRYNPNARFYGIGPQTTQEDKAFYNFDRVRGGTELDFQVFSPFEVSLPLQFMTVDSRPGPGNELSVQNAFPPSELPGFEDRLTYFITGLTLTHDTSDSELTPSRGGARRFQFLRFQGLGTTAFDFNQYLFDFRQYFSLWSPRHVLALHNAWQFQQTSGGDQVPFLLLSELDWKYLLRGFDRGRFRDNASVVFNFEYRFPIWDYINGVVFVDTGKVFPGITKFNFDNWRYSVGGGIHFVLRNFFLLNFQAGYGGEGAVLVLRLGPSI